MSSPSWTVKVWAGLLADTTTPDNQLPVLGALMLLFTTMVMLQTRIFVVDHDRRGGIYDLFANVFSVDDTGPTATALRQQPREKWVFVGMAATDRNGSMVTTMVPYKFELSRARHPSAHDKWIEDNANTLKDTIGQALTRRNAADVPSLLAAFAAGGTALQLPRQRLAGAMVPVAIPLGAAGGSLDAANAAAAAAPAPELSAHVPSKTNPKPKPAEPAVVVAAAAAAAAAAAVAPARAGGGGGRGRRQS